MPVEEELEPQFAPPPVPAPEAPPPISLGNRRAVLVALFSGLVGLFGAALLSPIGPLAIVAGGFVAVGLYRRLTGHSLTAMAGARLGWITGVFMFLGGLMSFTAAYFAEPDLMQKLSQGLADSNQLSQDQVNQVMEMLTSPTGIGLMVFFMFLWFTLLPAVGGALGAKLLGGGGRTPHQPHA